MDETLPDIRFDENWFSAALRSIGDAVIATEARGRVIFMNPVAQDLTGWTEAEARGRIEELNERLAAIVESSDDAIISKTLAGIITSWNQGAERLFGYAAEEVLGRPISFLMPEERVEDIGLILGLIRQGKRVDHY